MIDNKEDLHTRYMHVICMLHPCNSEDTDEFGGAPVVLDAVNNGEGELPLCQVLTEALVLCVLVWVELRVRA